MTKRDQGNTLQSFEDLNELVTRFPNSRYAPDARQRMVYLREELAKHEIGVGLYYLQRKAYVAAAVGLRVRMATSGLQLRRIGT